MPVMDNSKRFSCWTCKHFQEAEGAPGVLDGSGDCRALPPAACCEKDETEPVFPHILNGASSWCSAWMQRRLPGLGVCPPYDPN